MNRDDLPSLANLPHRIRASLANWPVRYREWRQQIRDNPAALWQTTIARVTLWLVLGLVLVGGLRWLVLALTPGGADLVVERATPIATLYVACTSTDCLKSDVTHQPMDFDDWPLTCEHCGHETVYRAKLCPRCRHWYANAPGQTDACPHCAAKHKQPPPDEPTTQPTGSPDDAEDPWSRSDAPDDHAVGVACRLLARDGPR